MDTKYAEIVIDIPVPALDQIYHYRIPGQYIDQISIGQAVKVPFGRRHVRGFVLGFSDQAAVEEEKIKDIIEITSNESLFDQEMLKLLKWMASYYKSYLISAIKTAIPTGVAEGKIYRKKIRVVVLNQSKDATIDIIKNLNPRATKQSEVLNLLLNQGQLCTVSELAREADTSSSTVTSLVKKGYLSYQEMFEERRPFLQSDESYSEPFKPTIAQGKIIAALQEVLLEQRPANYLLHGVTGSGKTEIYLQVIKEVLKNGKGAIILVPEISLTPMMVSRFYSRFGEQIAVLHSNLSLGERYDEWSRLQKGIARIAIGARSAVFAPIKNLGLIILDEEHENSYKQQDNPYYHARELALMRGKLGGFPVILGSATPSLESYYLAKTGKFNYFHLPDRVNKQELPPVKIIDMREELKSGNISIFSQDLQQAIAGALSREEQVLIFLNRRGYASFILCRECGHVIKCSNCDISLTYYSIHNHLRCHYCNHTSKLPVKCPECSSGYIREFGIGTERVEEELKKAFPEAVVDRMDMDTTSRKGSHRKILVRLEKGETDILVGTQMIAKGHDYPNISVVGVITADTILNLPDFRASERTFQLLTQVAGRTGRGDKKGQVIVQTYNPEHYSIETARTHNYYDFYQEEIKIRRSLAYPPFTQLVNIIIKGFNEDLVIQSAMGLGAFLKNYQDLYQALLGPSPAPIAKIRRRYRWQIILKFSNWQVRHHLLSQIEKRFLPVQNKNVTFNIDVDPLKML